MSDYMVKSSDYRLLVILSPLLSPMVVSGGSGACLAATRRRASVWNSPISNSRPRTEARAGVVWGNQKRVWKIQHKRERAAHQSTVWHNNKFSDIKPVTQHTAMFRAALLRVDNNICPFYTFLWGVNATAGSCSADAPSGYSTLLINK